MKLLLASGSKTRAEILDKAKIPYEVVEHNVDEDEAKISYAHLNPEDIATKLAVLNHHTSMKIVLLLAQTRCWS